MTTPPFVLPQQQQPFTEPGTGLATPVFYKFMRAFLGGTGGGVPFGTAANANIGTAGATVPLLNAGNIWSGIQSFLSGKLSLAGSASGAVVVNATAIASGTVVVPNGPDTLVGRESADTLTHKTITDSTNVISGKQLIGTATNDAASAGNVGELIETNVAIGSAISVTTAAAKSFATLVLAAGDFDAWMVVGTAPAAGTTTSAIEAAIGTVADTLPTSPNGGAYTKEAVTVGAAVSIVRPVGMMRVSSAAGITLQAVVKVDFAVSTMAVYGYIAARRRR